MFLCQTLAQFIGLSDSRPISTPVFECLYARVHVHTHAHTLLPVPASAFFQREGNCGCILPGKGKLWGNLAAPWEESIDATYLQLQSCFRLWPVSIVSIFPKPSNEPCGWQRVFILPLHFSFPLLNVTDWLGNGIWMPKGWHSEHLSMMEWQTSTKVWTSSPCGCHSFKAKSLAKKQGSWLIQTVTYCSMGSSCHL